GPAKLLLVFTAIPPLCAADESGGGDGQCAAYRQRHHRTRQRGVKCRQADSLEVEIGTKHEAIQIRTADQTDGPNPDGQTSPQGRSYLTPIDRFTPGARPAHEI